MTSLAGQTGCKYPTEEEMLTGSLTAPTGYVTCALGKYSFPETNKCLNCPKGHECPRIEQLPTPCSAGWYADAVNTVNCAVCPANYKCPTPYEKV
jgi:hypothetical protein